MGVRVTRTMTADSVALAVALSEIDPSWGTTISRVADGWAVLCGPGMFVNRLEGAGIDGPLDVHHLEQLELAAQLVGVAPAIALPEVAEAGNRELLRASGYQPDSAVSVGVMALDDAANSESLNNESVTAAGFMLETVATSETLQQWQRAAAIGWGYHNETGLRASNAFAEAAYRAPGSSLMLVRDVATGVLVATCALTVRDGLATLGGMSVLPAERRRGVQAAAIELRLVEAQRRGCDLAVTSTVVGGESERNVMRHGFRHSHAVTTWKKSVRESV